MTITPVQIPLAPYTPPQFRLLWRDGFGNTEDGVFPARSAADWNVITEPPVTGNNMFGGVELLSVHRRALPDIGTASFRYVFGQVANGQVLIPPELTYKDVRIQLRRDPSFPWKTVFWGRVDYQTDDVYAGAPQQMGVRTFHVVDGFARTLKWVMDRHVADPYNDGTVLVNHCYGNPGYNYIPSGDGIILGNKSGYSALNGGSPVTAHVWAGSHTIDFTASPWEEVDAVEHATGATRPDGEPWLRFPPGTIHNYHNKTPLTVGSTESVHEFVSKVYNRRRGFGCVWVDWSDVDGAAANGGALDVFFNFRSMSVNGKTITVPDIGATASVTYYGTTPDEVYRDIAGQPLTLDGDSRNAGPAQYAEAEMQMCDYYETLGEPIEVAVTLSAADTPDTLTQGSAEPYADISQVYDPTLQVSLAPRHSLTDIANFEALVQSRRIMPYWDHVYQLWGLPRNWRFTVANGGWGVSQYANSHRVDFRCEDDGTLYVPAFNSPQDTSALATELMDSIPFYLGYDYSGSYHPVRTDNTPQNGMPGRRPAQIYLHMTATGADRWFLPNGELPSTIPDKFQFITAVGNWSPTLNVYPDAIMVKSDFFTQNGYRVFGSLKRDQALAGPNELDAAFDITALAFTVGIRLPHRLRLCDSVGVPNTPGYPASTFANWQKARRRKSVYVPNNHLWLADYNCIWDLDQPTDPTANIAEGYLARRGALGATNAGPSILRTDLPRLALYHLAGSAWYLTQRNRAKWTQKYCGLLTFARQGFPDDTPPQLGSFIDTMNLNGIAATINSPITLVDYDHQAQTTSWEIEYFDLEFGL